MAKEFAHLHLHTQYSVLDGAIKIEALLKKAKSEGHSAVAITDHGVMHGAVEFYDKARNYGIKPIIGCEVYVTGGSRHDKKPQAQGGSRTYHLTLLAQNLTGYRNLCKLVSTAYVEGFYFKPRVDHELLTQHNEGIICLSGCLSSEIGAAAKAGSAADAKKTVDFYRDVFGDRLFLEVQPHDLAEQHALNELVRGLSQSRGIPLVATNDCHYLEAGDSRAQEVLTCISTGKVLADTNRLRHAESRLHYKSTEEMLAEMSWCHEAVYNTGDIAAMCGFEFDFSKHYMPQYEPPDGIPVDRFFIDKVNTEFEKRRAAGDLSRTRPMSEYRERLDREIDLIIKMGFAGYFLVVSDFIGWAKARDIPVGPGRGSAAGSLVAYALGITDIDPLEHKLLFERFLNPERVSLPDIDVDFCINGRDKVIEYVSEKYGKDHVSQILTFGTLKAKAAVKDVGRVLGMSYAETDKIAKLIPAPRQGFDYPLAEAIKMEKRLQEYAEGEGRELIELAQKLEGLSRHTSTHAAGVVISDRPIVEHLPLMVDKDGNIITQYSMSYVEKIGLVKFDFLGLKTLTVVNEALRLIKKATGTALSLHSLPFDDPLPYKLISSGRTIGIFQLESSGITEMVGRLRPNCFDDLVAILALYRPGPLETGMVEHYINRKHGREPVKYLHPLLEPILSDTYGIMIYQEQIMQIARDLAGYSLGEADLLRRAMGKKKPEEMAKQRERFIKGASEKGIASSVAEEVFSQMETFALYGFNRSHSAAYALVSFHTAYLKAHYPRCFMAALMTHEMYDTDKTLKNIGECRDMNIEVIPPDCNKGAANFTVIDDKVCFGLAGIRGIGERAAQAVVDGRERGGPYKDFDDFCTRMDGGILNRRLVEGFIKSGAFDWTGVSRAGLMGAVEDTLRIAAKRRQEADSAQLGLFGGSAQAQVQQAIPRNPVPEWPTAVKLQEEKEALGFYLSGHPLERFAADLPRLGSSSIDALQSRKDGDTVSVVGVITLLRLKNTKKGDRYATFMLEDMRSTIEVVVWPDTYSDVGPVLSGDDPVLVSARLDVSDERRLLIAQEIESLVALRQRTAKEAIVLLPAERASAQLMEQLRTAFATHKGPCPVKLVVQANGCGETHLRLPPDISVEPSDALCNLVETIVGKPVLSFV